MPAGATMVLHGSSGKYGFDWIITFDGGTKAHFYRDSWPSDDNVDLDVTTVGREALFDTGWGTLDMWATRRSDGAVNIRWEDGLTFQPYEANDEG